jgi:hypothetical protein
MITNYLFDAVAFAARVRRVVAARGLSLREGAAEADVALAVFQRALQAHPYTSHENILRLQAWLDRHAGAPRERAAS